MLPRHCSIGFWIDFGYCREVVYTFSGKEAVFFSKLEVYCLVENRDFIDCYTFVFFVTVECVAMKSSLVSK